jgi:hypothetical protein
MAVAVELLPVTGQTLPLIVVEVVDLDDLFCARIIISVTKKMKKLRKSLRPLLNERKHFKTN